MKAFIIILGVLLYALAPVRAQSSHPIEYFPTLYDTLTGSHYEAAWQIQETLEREFSERPAAPFARAIILYTAMIDFEDTSDEADFFQACEEVIKKCKEKKKEAEVDEVIWLEFLQGSILATRGFYVGRQGKIWPALKLLTRARAFFSRTLKKDPEFYDAHLGRGAYRWGIAKHAGVLSGLPFLPSKSDAFSDLRLAIDSSKFSRYTAASTLTWFLLEEKNFAEAESLIAFGLRRFPESRSFLWPLASLQFRTGRYQECIETSEKLVQQYISSSRNNGYDVVGLYKRMAEAAQRLGDTKAVIRFCQAGLSAYMTDEARQRRSNDLERLERWLKEAQKRHE